MTTSPDKDYVLGTHDDEINRLGLQHQVWRPTVQACWDRAGIGSGHTVIDVGAGPGFATVDLAERVGPTGQVHAVERSARFVEYTRQAVAQRGFAHVTTHERDLMEESLPVEHADAAWCRWVASFVSSPELLVTRIRDALKPGGVVVFHEYANYGTYRLAPRLKPMEAFVREVKKSWRANGGEPDVALELPRLLHQAGFTLRYAEPRVFALTPSDPMWEWTASFLRINLVRLVELGLIESAWAATVRAEFDAAERMPGTLMFTPTVLELVAERR